VDGVHGDGSPASVAPAANAVLGVSQVGAAAVVPEANLPLGVGAALLAGARVARRSSRRG
jgi:hypothetical protein